MRCGVGGGSFNERFVVRMVTAEFLRSLAADVAAGKPVELSSDDFPCFTAKALEGRAHVTPAALAEFLLVLRLPMRACSNARQRQSTRAILLDWLQICV